MSPDGHLPPRVLILSGIQLSANPRVVKEADTLGDAGYRVEVVGATVDSRLAERDLELCAAKPWTYTTLVDASSTSWKERFKWLRARARMRFAREAFSRFEVQSPHQLGYVTEELFRHAITHPAELTILHNPQAIWAGAALIRERRPVAVDMEDWYSEDLLSEDRKRQPVGSLQRWEGLVLREASYSTTTSGCLSRALAAAYDCPPPAVVYNSFPSSERNRLDGKILDRVDVTIPSLTWFSQVIGPGRGLETLMDALPGMKSVFEIHLRGNCRSDYRASLLARAPESWRSRIHFHSQVPHAELLSRIAEHDVGLAAEIPFCQSRALTITNKLLQYLLAGIAVVASDTEGQREAAQGAGGAVVLFKAGAAANLAEALDSLFATPARLTLAKADALSAALGQFSWERSAAILLEQVECAVRQSPRGMPGNAPAGKPS